MSLQPQDIVASFLDQEDNMKDLLYVNNMDTFYFFKSNGWYQAISESDLCKKMYSFCIANYPTIRLTANLIKDFIRQLRWQVINQTDEISYKYICFNDCLLNTETWLPEEKSREKITTFYLPFDYNSLPDAHPILDKFLATSLVTPGELKPDHELASLVQEMFGDCLLPEIKTETAYFLVGNGANGKSKLLDIIEEIIGKEFIVHSNIEKLTVRPFYLPALIGKKLNISNEEESKFLKSDTFKALITGNDVSAERKYGDPFDFKPNVKFIFASNKIPTFSDLNYGITRRIKIIPFYARFDRENPQTDIFILDKLKSELPAIVKWAIVGAKRLVENKYNLSYSKQSTLAIEELQGEISSAVMFFRESYFINNKEFTSNDEMYTEYKTWCQEVGRKPFSKSNFGRDLMNTFTDLKQKSGRVNSIMCRGKNCAKRDISEELEGVEGASTSGVDIENVVF